MVSRGQLQRLLEDKVQRLEKQVKSITKEIEEGIGQVSSDVLYRLGLDRNSLNTNISIINKQIANLKTRKGFLGEAIQEYSDSVHTKSL